MGAEVKASIDIGSNTVLLLVGTAQQGKVEVIYEEQFAPRLGRGVDTEKNLADDAVQRVIKILQKYKSKVEEFGLTPGDANVVATSAVRDANNRQEFIDRIEQETGFITQVASGAEEAKLTFLGAKSVLDPGNGTIAVLDIGGGSTEMAVGKGTNLSDRHSFDIGSVRFTERYLRQSPPTNAEVENCRNAVQEALHERAFQLPDDTKLVGVSGTVTSVAAIELGHQTYQPEKLNGRKFSVETISLWIEKISDMTANKLLEKYPKILEGRSDVFLAGLLILGGVMQFYEFDEILVSTGGIRHGALIG